MRIATTQQAAAAYDDFKAMVAALAPNGADVFYYGSTNLRSIYAIVRGEPGCKGEFPLSIETAGDLATFSISVSGTVLVDFPSAIEVKAPIAITP